MDSCSLRYFIISLGFTSEKFGKIDKLNNFHLIATTIRLLLIFVIDTECFCKSVIKIKQIETVMIFQNLIEE